MDLIEWDREKFRRMFPNLYQELEGANLPTVLDHLERCENEEQAREIIDYFERRGEITPEYASWLRENVRKLGILGTRKKGEYERDGMR